MLPPWPLWVQPKRGLPASIFQPRAQHTCQHELQILNDWTLLPFHYRTMTACFVFTYSPANFNINQMGSRRTNSNLPSFMQHLAWVRSLPRTQEESECLEGFNTDVLQRSCVSAGKLLLLCVSSCTMHKSAELVRYDVGSYITRCSTIPKLSFNGPLATSLGNYFV